MVATQTVERLKRRSQFLAVASTGRRVSASAFTLQVGPRPETDLACGVGFTATKRLGNAVVRNRARRRLKEAVRLTAPQTAAPGFDYVLIAREGALRQPFDRLVDDLGAAFGRVTKVPPKPVRGRR